MSFLMFEKSYIRHSQKEDETAIKGKLPPSFTNPDLVDAWRHRRMLDMIKPVIVAHPRSTWITIGDGNFGMDAYYLQNAGVDVLATSLTDSTLKVSAEQGFIQKYESVNAEQIEFEDEHFDYVLCKEAYHHFPRPAIAFYEMFRVAREAVVLIEPYDGPKRLLDMIKEPMKKLLWGKNETIHFEPCGNYIYRINQKQMGKNLAAMGYTAIAHKTFNDIYLPRYGNSKCGFSKGHVLTKLALLILDVLCALHLMNPALVGILCFKKEPSSGQQSALKKCGFKLTHLPVNPYI